MYTVDCFLRTSLLVTMFVYNLNRCLRTWSPVARVIFGRRETDSPISWQCIYLSKDSRATTISHGRIISVLQYNFVLSGDKSKLTLLSQPPSSFKMSFDIVNFLRE